MSARLYLGSKPFANVFVMIEQFDNSWYSPVLGCRLFKYFPFHLRQKSNNSWRKLTLPTPSCLHYSKPTSQFKVGVTAKSWPVFVLEWLRHQLLSSLRIIGRIFNKWGNFMFLSLASYNKMAILSLLWGYQTDNNILVTCLQTLYSGEVRWMISPRLVHCGKVH